jgi:hypothetical protein
VADQYMAAEIVGIRDALSNLAALAQKTPAPP